MRDFIDEGGFFKLKIPKEWHYNLMNSKVHTFNDFKGGGTFQISFNKKRSKKYLYQKIGSNFPKNTMGKCELCIMPIEQDGDLVVNTLIGAIDKYNITVTFIYSKNSWYSENTGVKNELIKEIISGIQLLGGGNNSEISGYRLKKFLQGLSATQDLLNNAIAGKSFIEAVCLFANQIDALLRTGLILKHQLIQKSSAIELRFLYQGNSDRVITEKQVYRQAKEINVIDDNIFKSLMDLYDDRNKVVHRYIISEILTSQIEIIARRYARLVEKVRECIVVIEDEQINKKIGMTVKGKPNSSERVEDTIEQWLKEKHGGINYPENK